MTAERTMDDEQLLDTAAALIMAGGTGTRFWPLSRRQRPKQLLSLGDHPVMLRATVDRLRSLLPPERILVITARDHEEPVREICDDLPDRNVVGEPVGRDTAACVGLGALMVERFFSPETVMGVFPADHYVGSPKRFEEAIRVAKQAVRETDGILTFGIRPSHPATSYGYIIYRQNGEFSIQGRDVYPVDRFTEKPDREDARRMIERRDALWNSGIFFWSPRTILAEIRQHLSRLHEGLVAIRTDWSEHGSLREVLDRHYESLPAISVDYGVLERAGSVWTQPVDFDWSDLGTWDKLGRVVDADSSGNLCVGDQILYDCRDSVVVNADGPFVGALGLRDVVVVSTEDAVLVCPRERVEDVRELVDRLENQGRDEYL